LNVSKDLFFSHYKCEFSSSGLQIRTSWGDDGCVYNTTKGQVDALGQNNIDMLGGMGTDGFVRTISPDILLKFCL
jgi:hypothetical protein